jgi:predicted PurR-regulated permease PerM
MMMMPHAAATTTPPSPSADASEDWPSPLVYTGLTVLIGLFNLYALVWLFRSFQSLFTLLALGLLLVYLLLVPVQWLEKALDWLRPI